MATSPTDKSIEEEEVQTEELDPAKTTEEEEEVRTEEEEVQTEEEEVRTEEQEVRTEEVGPAKTTEEEVRTEEEDEPKEEAIESLLDSSRQEDSITIRSSDQTIDRGSTSLTSDQNPQEQSITIHRSGQTGEGGSTSFASDQNCILVLSGARMPHHGPSVPPYHQSLSVTSLQNQRFILPHPRWLVVDHYYTDGFGLHSAQWRFRTISPLLPNQIVSPQHQLSMMELPNQPGLVLVRYTQSFGMLQPPQSPPTVQQNQLVPYVARGHQAPPMMRQDQYAPYLLTGQVPVRIAMEQNTFFTYLLPASQAPNPEQEQDQIVYTVVIGQAPVRPMMQQNQIVNSLGQLEAPIRQPPVMLYSPPPIVNVVPVRPVMNYNQGQQRLRFPMNMIQHQPSPSAAAPPRAQQLQPQTQQPWQSQGSNTDGPSSSSSESEG